MQSVLAVKELPNFNGSIPTNEVGSKHKHLTGLNFPEISKQKVESLIGADVWQAHVIHGSIEGEPDQPRALRTGLGWILFGPDPRTHSSDKYIVNCVQGTNDVLDEMKTNDDVILPDARLMAESRLVLKGIVNSFNPCKDKRKDILTVGCTRQIPAGCTPLPMQLIGGKSSPACASYALRKLADSIETHASSETVLIVKRRFDVDDSLKSENSVD